MARLQWADATLRAEPRSLDAALAALDEIASVPLDGIQDVLIAWHWLVCAAAFRRLSQPDAEREALEHARCHLQNEDTGSSPLLRRLRRWLAP